MSRSDTVDLVAQLLRVTDARELLSSLQQSGALRGARAVEVRSWRLYPMKRGGFAAGFTVVDAAGGLHHLYSVIHGSGELSASEFPASSGTGAPGALSLFLPEQDPKMSHLGSVLRGDLLQDANIPVCGPGDLVAYRPLGRAVVRFGRDPQGSGEVFLRVSASKRRYARIRTLSEVAAGVSESAAGPAPRLFPRVLSSFVAARAIAIEGIEGETLHQAMSADQRVLSRHIAESCESVAALHQASAAALGVHGALDDAEATSWALRRGALADPASLRGFGDDLEILFEAAPSIEPLRLRVIHRDLHDKQLLRRRDGGGVVLLDTDTLAVGDPALDLANLTAHLELREMQGRLAPGVGTRLSRALLDVYGTRAPLPDPKNLTYYAACTWLRLAGVYALRSGGQALVPALMERGRTALRRLRETP